jgi:hypothetical protein
MNRKLIQYKEGSDHGPEAEVPKVTAVLWTTVRKIKDTERNAYLARVLTDDFYIGSRDSFEQYQPFLKDLIEKTAYVKTGIFKRCALEYLETLSYSYRQEEPPAAPEPKIAVYNQLEGKKNDPVLNNIWRFIDFSTAELLISDYNTEDMKKMEVMVDSLRKLFNKTEVNGLTGNIEKLKSISGVKFTEETYEYAKKLLNRNYVYKEALMLVHDDKIMLEGIERDEKKVLKEFFMILTLYYSQDKTKKALNEGKVLADYVEKLKKNFKELKNVPERLKQTVGPQAIFNYLSTRLGAPDKLSYNDIF